ncbi:hypothetical protein LX70_03036 [Defluviimonas denitrificans]|jgi:hypothetical protein|uniref:Uncharacterized protein n=1 Tax=Albidovulum denitrificans TaxID=404881 RepID=A0A2S8S4K4_9RHOB|nr:hypothetical protein [Defluviimonas denitrificans]PQV55715.1 hypothetical protein LX70_03036 [Defluviimonas denitrificans]
MTKADISFGITAARLRAGQWQGELHRTSAETPAFDLYLGAERIGPVEVARGPARDTWHLSVAVPAGLLSDGVQTFLIRDTEDGETLAHFTIVAGEAADADMRAELDLMRAELDMLKKAFRRYCAAKDH